MPETPEPIEPESPVPVGTVVPEADSPETDAPETDAPETDPEPSSTGAGRPEPSTGAPGAAARATRRGRLTLIAATLVYFTWSLVIGVLATRNDWSPLPRMIRFVLGILLWVAIWKGHRWARLTTGALALIGLVGGSILAYFSGLLVLAKASPLVLVAWALLFDGATKDYIASRKRAARAS